MRLPFCTTCLPTVNVQFEVTVYSVFVCLWCVVNENIQLLVDHGIYLSIHCRIFFFKLMSKQLNGFVFVFKFRRRKKPDALQHIQQQKCVWATAYSRHRQNLSPLNKSVNVCIFSIPIMVKMYSWSCFVLFCFLLLLLLLFVCLFFVCLFVFWLGFVFFFFAFGCLDFLGGGYKHKLLKYIECSLFRKLHN